MHVYKAINAVQADLAREGIGKDRSNQQQGYKFRGIDDVYNALSPLLAKHGLCVLPRCTSREVVERINAKGTALFYVTVCAEFDFVAAEDGSKHTVVTYGEAMDSGDKATNKAMSAAYKYACMQAFSIPTEGDNDADATTHEVRPTEKAHLGLTPARAKIVRAVAAAAIQKHNEGNEWGAFEEVSGITDSDEKMALWEVLKPHSDLRACIKRLAAEAARNQPTEETTE
jgi:hypothetical protein